MTTNNLKYKILLVDDDNETLTITRLVLSDYKFNNHECEIISATSGEKAKEILNREKEIAIIFVDVVMEEHDSGLKLVKFIRNVLRNNRMKIIIRTGQPGYAPEDQIIFNYDINDYLLKSDTTSQRLKTSLTTALRSYEQQKKLEINKSCIEKIVLLNNNIYNKKYNNNTINLIFSKLKEFLFDMNLLSSVNIAIGENNIINLSSGLFNQYIGKDINDIKILQSMSKVFSNIYYANGRYYFNRFFNSTFILLVNTENKFQDFEIEILDLLFSNINILMENIKLDTERLDAHKEILLTLSEIIENKSNETVFHVKRVAQISTKLAELHGFDQEQTNLIKIISPMHDVGKIGIPDNILNKPGKLTDSEFDIIKSHSEIGYNILKNSKNKILKNAATVAFEHHERWDGKGYPMQKKGEEININARIVAIADVFDALINERIYKKAWPEEKVYNYYKEMRGVQFDPDISDTFIKYWKKFIEINRSLQ